MPTPTGLPKVGEKWQMASTLPPDWETERVVVTILARGTGSYWSVRVRLPDGQVRLWVDASYSLTKGEFTYVEGPA